MPEQRKVAEWFGLAVLAISLAAFFFVLWVLSLRHAAESLGDALTLF
jgi:hypothetical protein